jgi:hypothetical protein
MDERSYLHVASTLNTYGLWTTWCSEFLTDAGFKLIGMPHLERSLRSAGWHRTSLTLYNHVDPGSGFGYGHVLVDNSISGDKADAWLKAVRDHVTDHHMSFVLNGQRTHCAPGVPVLR